MPLIPEVLPQFLFVAQQVDPIPDNYSINN